MKQKGMSYTLAVLSSLLPLQAHTAVPIYSPYLDFTLNAQWTTTPPTPANFLALTTAANIKHVRLAFITDEGNCTPAWGGSSNFYASAPNNPSGTTQVKELANSNVKYTISFGGNAGTDLSKNCTQDQLTNAYIAVLTAYNTSGLEGVDFDIENGTPIPTKIINSVKALQGNPAYNKLKYSFTFKTLPNAMDAPTTGVVVPAAKAANLTFSVNLMTMDYKQGITDMGKAATDAANALHDYLVSLKYDTTTAWSMIQITPMIGLNDSGEFFSLANASSLYQYAINPTHPLSVLSSWSLSRDLPCAAGSSPSTCSGANATGAAQTAPYQFAQALSGLTNTTIVPAKGVVGK